jgi:hypothetical protein
MKVRKILKFTSIGYQKALIALAVALLALSMNSAMAGNIYFTGHDTLLHDGQTGYDQVILDYLRGAGTTGEIPAANYSIGVIGSNAGFWGWSNVGVFNDRGTGPNVPPGYLSTTYYSTVDLDGNAALQATALSHDGLIILSHTSCGGCDLSTAGSDVINTQMMAGITAAFNAGMDLWVNSGANLATYYDFLPPAFATTGPPISGSVGFVATPAGVAIGILASHINGFQTHNRFTGFSPLLTVMETRAADEIISMGAQDISLSGNLSPDLALNPPDTDHSVDLQVLGTVVNDVGVDFEVISGPNLGDNGTDLTDAAGIATFTYTGDGGIGVDEIQAFFADAAGNPVESNVALKFWDNDCQPNDIPDTCDIDCGGFDGLCSEYADCGGSTDNDGGGVPDECAIQVSIDIKFCSDPNAFNCKKKGVLPVTIFGTEFFDLLDPVSGLDISSLQLCVAGDLSNCTNEPKDFTVDDRGTPDDAGADMCAIDPVTEEELRTLNPDGYLDIDAVFEASEVQAMLGDFCGGPKEQSSPTLVIIGQTLDGTPIFSAPIGDDGIDQLVKKK